MMDEPNSLNHHNHHYHHDDQDRDITLPPELDALAARLAADGVAWQNRLPDAAPVAERIRAIPNTSSPVATDDRFPEAMMEAPTIPPGIGDDSITRPLHRDDRRRGSPGVWGRLLGLVAAVVVVALLATVLAQLANRGDQAPGPIGQPTQTQAQTQPTPVPTNPAPTLTPALSPTATASGYPVLVYFSKNPDSYNDFTMVFAVHRTAPTKGVATYAIQQLIAGPTSSEAAAGYFTELTTVLQRTSASNCGGADFKITLNTRGATSETGTATLQFCRQLASPGIGADARIKAEITKTLTQFSNITKVVILLSNGHCFADESGADFCLQ